MKPELGSAMGRDCRIVDRAAEGVVVGWRFSM